MLICESGDGQSDLKAVKILEEFSDSELEIIRTRKIQLEVSKWDFYLSSVQFSSVQFKNNLAFFHAS